MGLRKFNSRLFVMSEVYRKRGDDLPDDFVLQREDVVNRSIVALRPEMLATQRVDELRIDANGVTLAPDTSLQHVTHAEILGHLLHLHGFALVGRTGVARNDQDSGELGKIRDDVVGHAIGEVTVLRTAADAIERQDREGRPFRKLRRGRQIGNRCRCCRASFQFCMPFIWARQMPQHGARNEEQCGNDRQFHAACPPLCPMAVVPRKRGDQRRPEK